MLPLVTYCYNGVALYGGDWSPSFCFSSALPFVLAPVLSLAGPCLRLRAEVFKSGADSCLLLRSIYTATSSP
jgi:hypothetical protein